MASTKVKNNLFVWGNSSLNATDLASLNTGSGEFNQGFEGGSGIYADILNSALRSPTLLTSCLIEVLKEGPVPVEDFNIINKDYNTAWDSTFPAAGYDFKYSIADIDYDDFVNNLKTVIDQYLAYSQVRHALNANAWTTARNFRIVDTASTPNKGSEVSVDGTSVGGYEIPLPSTIHATLDGNAATATDVLGYINGTDILTIFENNGRTVKTATLAAKATNLATGGGAQFNPVYFDANGHLQSCSSGTIYYKNLNAGIEIVSVVADPNNTTPIPGTNWNFDTTENFEVASVLLHGSASKPEGGLASSIDGFATLSLKIKNKIPANPFTLAYNKVYKINIAYIINYLTISGFNLRIIDISDLHFNLILPTNLSKYDIYNSEVGKITKEDYIYLVEDNNKIYLTNSSSQSISCQTIEISCNILFSGSLPE